MTESSAADLVQAAIAIATSAAAIPMRHFRTDFTVEDKADASPVTVADRETETFIRGALAARFPAHGVLGEEFGAAETDAEYVWVVDPIDGTRSFVCGVPLFGTLLGVLHQGRPLAGVINMPALGECYAGGIGVAGTVNGVPTRCRDTTDPAAARIFLNEANRLIAREPERLKRLMEMGHIRRFFNDCYAFALLAGGRIDAVVDFDLQPYDYLPVVPVVEAAGGIITDWQGAPLGLRSDGTVLAAATPALHATIMDRLR